MVLVDYSKNIESQEDVKAGTRDPLWINFVNKGDVFKKIKAGVATYKKGIQPPQRNDLFADKELLQGYEEYLLRARSNQIINV